MDEELEAWAGLVHKLEDHCGDLQATLREMALTRVKLSESWWSLRNAVDAMQTERECEETLLQDTQRQLDEAQHVISVLEQKVSHLSLKCSQAPPPRWLLRSARKAKQYGITTEDAVHLAKKCMRWADTWNIKNSDKEQEDGEVQEDAGL